MYIITTICEIFRICLFGIPTQPNENFKPGRLDVRVKCNDMRVLANVFLFFFPLRKSKLTRLI